MKKLMLLSFVLAVSLVLLQGVSEATVLSAIGDGYLYASSSAPAESNSRIYAIDEQQGLTLTSDLLAGVATVGNYTSVPGLTTISQGTIIDSHLLLFSPTSGTPDVTGTFTFSGDILGVMVVANPNVGTDTLTPSDYLQQYAWSSVYDGTAQRGLELGTGGTYENYTILNANTIELDILYCGERWMDQMRVITASSEIVIPGEGGDTTPIPEPASMLLMALGLLGIYGFKSRIKK